MVAKVIPIGSPVNDAERHAIAYLRDALPSTATLIHNFEIRQGNGVYEIDLAILLPHCVYIVDVKGTLGRIDVYGSKWHPEGRQPYHSPLAKLRQHAKILKAIIIDAFPAETSLRNIHVHAAVLMTAPDANVVDHSGVDGPDITYLPKCLAFFQDKSHVPSHRSNAIQSQLHLIEKAITGKAKPISSPMIYREWQLEERLGGDNRYTEYRAKHSLMGKRGGFARLRVYQVDPYQDATFRDAQRNRISNAYRAVVNMAPHSNILTVREFFQTEDEDRFVLVTEDVEGVALSQHIKNTKLALTFDQKLGIIRNVLSALDHAHKYEVIHRNLTPDAIIVTPKGNARLMAFDYARVGKDRSSTIADQIIDDLDEAYQAPECFQDPSAASISSDLFSIGLIFYELLTRQAAFENNEQLFDVDAIFPIKPSTIRPDLPAGFDAWLQKLCSFDPEDRYISALIALRELEKIILQVGTHVDKPQITNGVELPKLLDYSNLATDTNLANRFIVQEKLGKPGGFGVAYKVFDTFSDQAIVLKLITRDRQSVLQRLKREYKTLLNLPAHPNVVKVIWADQLPDETPFIAFEYLEGFDVQEMIDKEILSIEDALQIVKDAAKGLVHLHNHSVFHQDIKPSNLLWTNQGVRLIDFNVAAASWDADMVAGGTRRYIPPDYELTFEPTVQDNIDRDLYALGITFYECITGRYPFDEPMPGKNKIIRDPRELTGNENLSEKLVNLLTKLLSPQRSNRFKSAQEFELALASLPQDLRVPITPGVKKAEVVFPIEFEASKLNFNNFVSHLLTLYSQSQGSNIGTRGLDQATYVTTKLDKYLLPTILDSEYQLVIITGNAGDGKTAFIQKIENQVQEEGIEVIRNINGSQFILNNKQFITVYDGSQDEGDKENREVLSTFFAPYQGTIENKWPENEIRIIAINEGRLVDFLRSNAKTFPKLLEIVEDGLAGQSTQSKVVVINLNLRSIVASENGDEFIFTRLIQRITTEEFWAPCLNCDLKDHCYIHHNARTFIDPVAGPKIIERMEMLFTITHLRQRLHITIRDLRSAAVYMLVGTKNCDEVHTLYSSGSLEARREILSGFYFNAWMGGNRGSTDRLVTLLRDIDVGRATNPEIDRSFAFLGPEALRQSQFSFTYRGSYDHELLRKEFRALPGLGATNQRNLAEINEHINYSGMVRRRFYFERRDNGWQDMLPYQNFDKFYELIKNQDAGSLVAEKTKIIHAISKGEGLVNPNLLFGKLALGVRHVERGTIQSYRLFDEDGFQLLVPGLPDKDVFIEFMPQSIQLIFDAFGNGAILDINLDIYEMLSKLNQGYRPTNEELQGYYISLSVFKNILASAPYQEILLSEMGYDFHKIKREPNGVLRLEKSD